MRTLPGRLDYETIDASALRSHRLSHSVRDGSTTVLIAMAAVLSKLKKASRILLAQGPGAFLSQARISMFYYLDEAGRKHGMWPSSFFNSSKTHQVPARRQNVFENIYDGNKWGSSESLSGPGSEIAYSATYRSELSDFIMQYNIKSIFDAPCGDLNWFGGVLEETPVAYIGGDISNTAISVARARHPNLDLRIFDICEDAFPETDIWHCRDCLFHLSYMDIQKAFRNFLKSNSRFCLLTTHHSRLLRNHDIATGDYRFLDLRLKPFMAPPATCYLTDYRKGIDFPRYVGLWKREDVQMMLSHLERAS